MGKSKKILLFMVEGSSDRTALEYILKKIFSNDQVLFHVIGTDITSDNKTTLQNAIKKVKEQLDIFLGVTKAKEGDILKIIHVVDTDGTYIPATNIIEDKSLNTFVYTTDNIKGKSSQEVEDRNKRKANIINKLSTTPNICRGKISYRMYYMSCNLEHVLHNIQDAIQGQKADLSEEFLERFIGQENNFISFIQNPLWGVLGEYNESWKFIKQGTNSLKRYSNLGLIFEEEV